LVRKIKEAKQKLTFEDDLAHEQALNELRDAEEAYHNYLHTQEP
jgi:hypothetical protein